MVSTMTSMNAIREMADRIVGEIQPRCVILFGSHARQEANENSDIDLFVIADTSLPRPERSARLYSLLRDYPVSKDILVYTPDEAEEYLKIPGSLARTAFSEGIVLYEG